MQHNGVIDARDDSYIQVRFDPRVKQSRRRKSSLQDSTGSHNSDRAGTAFLHKILGSWQQLQCMPEIDEEKNDAACEYIREMSTNQLHEMVLGLREMGRKYANVKLRMDVRNVFILTKTTDKSLTAHTRQLSKWLLENTFNV